MKRKLIFAMALFALSGCGSQTPEYPSDVITTLDGTQVRLTFFKHASLALSFGKNHIYIDPIDTAANYAALAKAEMILITHSHDDHLDPVTIEKLRMPETLILADSTSCEVLNKQMNCIRMIPGDNYKPEQIDMTVEAVPAYNITEGHLQFHPQERRDCGYILTIGGTRFYIAGDTEPTPELLALKEIDIAFLPVNQPYTMTVDQAVEAVKAIRPTIFYPYHYGMVDQKTDIDRLVHELQGVTEIRVRPME